MNHAIAKKRSFKGRLSSLPYNWHVAPYIFLIPFILSFLIFNVYPIFSSFVMSLQKIRGFGSATWVGLDNYQKLLNNAFYASLKTTTLVTVCNCVVLIVLPMLLALLLNNLHLRGRNGFRATFFIPARKPAPSTLSLFRWGCPNSALCCNMAGASSSWCFSPPGRAPVCI